MTAESLTETFSNEDLHLKFESTRETAAPNHVTRYYLGNVVLFAVLHISGLYGLYLLGFTEVKWQTIAFVAALYWMGVIGVTGGNHRLWSHRTYKANLPLRSLLMFFSTTSFQGEVFQWARDHRVHHKYQDTDADPYNIRRGFWFAHVGWLLQKKHPLVIEKGKTIDLSDLTKDEVVMFQKRYFWYLLFFFSLFLPTIIPMYFWGESLKTAWYVATSLRIVLCFNTAAIVNSVAHTFGNRPYDSNFLATQSPICNLITLGEGWHNYHHAFPWDYKAAELGKYGFNFITAFINFFAMIGWAYDLKTVSPGLVRKRVLRTGDGTHPQQVSWGWNDKDIPREEKEEAYIFNRKD